MPIDVLTNRYNPGRTGANLDEATLNQSNVNVNSFGKVFTRNVDGQIYAQPLIVRELTFPDIGRHSAVFVATTRNMVYAFDAEDPEACHPFWRVNLDEPAPHQFRDPTTAAATPTSPAKSASPAPRRSTVRPRRCF